MLLRKLLFILVSILLFAGSASAQFLYKVNVKRWTPVDFGEGVAGSWETPENIKVYFVINQHVFPAQFLDVDGYYQANLPEREQDNVWSAYVGPYRYQFLYHSGSDVGPDPNPNIGGGLFRSRDMSGTLYFTDVED